MSESVGTTAKRLGGQLQIGQQLGNYRIVRPLGQGGMGTVFEAVHQYIERSAAVKVLHPDLSQNPQFASRFLNEARAVNLIKHPGLVEIFEFGLLEDGTAYIIMEFLSGLSLSEYLRRSPSGLGNEALPICRQIALAMAAAHQKGIVHRDLKPDNVMLAPDPERPGERRVKVLDFGIAKLSHNASGPDGKVQTETGAMIGTPAYMAPEQCLADPNLDGKADVYALGIMLYEMLAARLPFVAQHSFDFMAAHVRGNPRPLGEVAPHAPPEVANLVHAMMAKSPAERPSMEAVVALLDQLRAALPAIWAMPRLSGPFPQVSSDSMAMGATGVANPSPRPSKELIELGATVPGMPTPSRSGKDSVTPTDRAARPAALSASSQPKGATPLPAVLHQTPVAHVTPTPTAPEAPVASEVSRKADSEASSRVRLWLGAALALLLTCGVTAVVMSRLGARPVAPVTAPSVSVAPRLVKWVVSSVPAGAEVVRADGQIMGSTPWELTRPAESGETVLRLHHSGFQDKTMVLNRGADVKIELHLEPVPEAPAPPQVTEPPASEKPRPGRHPGRRSTKKSSGGDVQLLLD